MEATLVSAAGTLAFGGGGIAIVSYLAYQYGKAQLQVHQDGIRYLCEAQKTQMEHVCTSFDNALLRRDKDIESLVNEIRRGKSNNA